MLARQSPRQPLGRVASLALVRLVIERVPNGALTVFPGEGHYLDSRHHPEMLEFLTGWR